MHQINWHMLNDNQKKALRFLNENINQNAGYMEREFLQLDLSLGDEDYDELLSKLSDSGIVEIEQVDNGVYASFFRTLPRIRTVVKELDNPPLKDYPKTVVEWFRSKLWSIPIALVVIVLPLIVGYIEMIQKIMKWLSVGE